MKSRSLFLTIAAGLLVAGIGARDARAASVTLPTALDPGLVTTTLTTPTLIEAVSNGNTFSAAGLTFSGFGYSSTAIGTVAVPATSVGVTGFSAGNETGFSLSAPLSVSTPNTTLDVAITYTVTAAPGTFISDATLVMAGSTTGSGSATVSETLLFPNLSTVGLATNAGSLSQTVTFAPVTSIQITKDIDLSVGSSGGAATISVVSQGFSTSAIPEPSSLALLGIGMTGFLAFRRLFKRTSVA